MEFVCILAFKDFFNLVIEASAKFKGSKWDQKIQKHPEAFNFYKSMIDNYFKKEWLWFYLYFGSLWLI